MNTRGSQEMVRVVVCDSNRIGTQVLSQAVGRQSRFQVIEAVCNAVEIAAAKPDVAVISADLDGKALKGCELIRELHLVCPELRTIVLIEESTRERVVDAFRAGARGVFCRTDSFRSMCKCILGVHRGHVWANKTQLSYLLEALREPWPIHLVDAKGSELLSNREREVVRWVAEGLPNREIADRLKLSEHTVKNYLFHIFDKLGISNRVELILYVVSQLSKTQQQGNLLPDSVVCGLCKAPENCIGTYYARAELYRGGNGLPLDMKAACKWYVVAEMAAEDVARRSRAAQQLLKNKLGLASFTGTQRAAAEWWSRKRLNGSDVVPNSLLGKSS